MWEIEGIGLKVDTVPNRTFMQPFFFNGERYVGGEVIEAPPDTSGRFPRYSLVPSDTNQNTFYMYREGDYEPIVFTKVDTVRKIFYKHIVYSRDDIYHYTIVGYMCRKATDTSLFNEIINSVRWKGIDEDSYHEYECWYEHH